MTFRKLARRGWLLTAEVVLVSVGMAVAFLSLSAARAGLSTALRVPHPNRTYFVGRRDGQVPQASGAEFASWRGQRGVFSRVGAFSVWGPVVVETASQSLSVEAASVTIGMTRFLPQRMAAGRVLIDSDFYNGLKNVLVTQSLVARLGPRFASGSLVQTNWGTFQIVGVLPAWARFPYPNQPDIIIPTVPNSQDPSTYTVLGELRPGLTREQAERQLNSAPGGGRATSQPVQLVSMKASLDPGVVRISQYGLVLGSLTLLLLVATAALIELLDAVRGKRERSIKLALGATQGGLALDRALEVFIICVLATAAGGILLAVGWPWFAQVWGTDWVAVPRVDVFTLESLGALLLFVCIAVSIAPVLIARATRAYAALKEERPSTSRTARRTRMAIITLQVAVSMAFGFGAANLAGGLYALATEPLGIDVANVWFGSAQFSSPLGITASAANNEQEARQDNSLREQLRARLRSLPGVASVGFASEGPAEGEHGIATGGAIAAMGERFSAANSLGAGAPVTGVDQDYLQLLGCRLLAGRYFTPADELGPVSESFRGGPVILSAPVAKRLFGSVNVVGREVGYFSPTGEPLGGFNKVVGVVSGMRTFGLRAPIASEIFTPLSGMPLLLALRMKGSGAISLTEVQREVSDVIPWMRIGNFEPLRKRFDSELAVPRQRLGLLALFAAISGGVAFLGLASVLLVIIKERDLEIGIRRALGASDLDLATALLKKVLPWIGLGLTAGLAFPILYPVPLGVGVASGAPDAKWAGASAVFAMLVLIAVSLWLPLRRAFRRPINDLLKVE